MWPNITHYCKFWERHPRLEITCQYNIGKLIWLHKWKKKKGTKKIFTTGVVKSRGDRAEENSGVTRSHTKSHPPHSSCCSTLVLLRSHKRLDFTCIHNYLNQSAVVFFLLFFLVLFFRGQKNAMSLFLVELVFFKFLSQMGFTAQAFVVIFFLQNRQPSILLVFTSTSYSSWHLCVPDKTAKD